MRRFGVPEQDALDAAQEVFVIAYRQWERFRHESALSTWLCGIACRVAREHCRRLRKRREQPPNGTPCGCCPDDRTDIESQDLVRILEAVLNKLPAEQREVFTLFEMEGLTGEQIGMALQIPVGTVRSRLRLARDAFQRAAEEWMQAEFSCKLAGAE